ncbi:hypothetical protein L6452_18290 [Arctium lappa]|uniref:Uncharacterized protein n=1 Tax=Arctium lappa TaxID=4217 RepID=A0ACB9C5R2_ARCLA|nr:hypothetical protein L6452_18290 [Arctium lappa]
MKSLQSIELNEFEDLCIPSIAHISPPSQDEVSFNRSPPPSIDSIISTVGSSTPSSRPSIDSILLLASLPCPVSQDSIMNGAKLKGATRKTDNNTNIPMSPKEGGESEIMFFQKLDEELNKVNTFYRDKVEEAASLNKQMNALIALQIKVEQLDIDKCHIQRNDSMDRILETHLSE